MSQEKLGNVGEKLVASILEHHFKQVVEMSENQFDAEKDLLADGIRVEVKTQTPFYKFKKRNMSTGSQHDLDNFEPHFTISINGTDARNQLSKCMNVERLIFVQNPVGQKEGDEKIRVFEAPPIGQRIFTIKHVKSRNEYVAGFPMNKMKLLYVVDNKAVFNAFKKYNISNFAFQNIKTKPTDDEMAKELTNPF